MSRRALIGAVAVFVAIAAAILFWPRPISGEMRPADAARLMNELMSGKVPVGGSFALDDQWGKPRTLDDFRDRKGNYVAFFPPGTKPDRMAVMVREALESN
jgi:cytochrome oxidase Cu insertion factor (SCO1/SenC/PrrC family)